MAIDFKAQAEALRDELIARRRDLHQHPELAFEEVRTAGIVAQELNNLGLEVRTGVGKTGVIGLLEGGRDGLTILVRADMDALPILEENAIDYISTVPHKMHACGHDGHTAIALGVAKLLSQRRDQIAGRVKFVFQPAEEIGAGAKAMITDGALLDPRPDVSVGLHLWNSLPVGTIGIGDGPVMAGASVFDIKVTGKGAHAASPHQGIDPVVCAAQIVTAFQTIVSRSVDPLDTLVISVTTIRAGDVYNVIPQFAELRGTVRYFNTAIRDLARERLREIAVNIGFAMRCEVEFNLRDLTIPVVNHPEVGAKLRALFEQVEGVTALDLTARTMGAEDVSLFMDDIPGTYFFVGAQDMTADAYYGHHHPRFTIDEDAIPLSVALLSTAVAAYVLPESYMPSVNVLRWIDGRGWIVLSGGADEDIRAQAINRSSADGGVALIALDGFDDQMSDDISNLGAPSSYAVDVFTEDDESMEHKLAESGVVIISSAASADDVRSALYGAAISGIQQAFANGAVILLEGASAAAFGSWLASLANGLEWVEGALVLVGMQNAAARAKPVFDAHPTAVAIGIEVGSALALGPDGQIEPWGNREVTIALGSAYGT